MMSRCLCGLGILAAALVPAPVAWAGDCQIELFELTPPDVEVDDLFGFSVDVRGDFAAIAARGDNDLGTNAGAVYVYRRDDEGTWSLEQKILADDGKANDAFGTSVSLDGGRLAVGAMHDDDFAPNAGAVYLFERRESATWVQTDKLTFSEGRGADFFGVSCELSGNTLFASSRGAVEGRDDAGVCYVFDSTDGDWTEIAKLTPGNPVRDGFFGHALAFEEDLLVVGSINGFGRVIETGSVCVFRRPEGGWVDATEDQVLFDPDGRPGDFFGIDVSFDGSRILVGARRDDDGASDSGSAFVFDRGPEGFSLSKKFVPQDARPSAQFGNKVTLEGNTAVVGAWSDAPDGGTRTGSVYLYHYDSKVDDWLLLSKIGPEGGDPFDSFGHDVALNNDTLVVAAYERAQPGDDAGAAWVSDLSSCLDTCIDVVASRPAGGERLSVRAMRGVPGARVAIGGRADAPRVPFVVRRGEWCANLDFDPSFGLRMLGVGVFDAKGYFSLEVQVPKSLRGREIALQAAVRGGCPEGCGGHGLRLQVPGS